MERGASPEAVIERPKEVRPEPIGAERVIELPGIVPLMQRVADALGNRDEYSLRYQLLHLSQGSPWEFAGRFSNPKDAIAQTYLVLAEAGRLGSKERVVASLAAFVPGDLDAAKARLRSGMRVEKRYGVRNKDGFVERKIPVLLVKSDADPLALAAEGAFGCVRHVGNEYVAESKFISDGELSNRGLAVGFQETEDPLTGAASRSSKKTEGSRDVWIQREQMYVPVERMVPVAKRLGKGSVSTYGDMELAVRIASSAIEARAVSELFRRNDEIMHRAPNDRRPENLERYAACSAERFQMLADHFGGTFSRVESVPEDLVIPEGRVGRIDRSSNAQRFGRMDVGKRTYLLDLTGGPTEVYDGGSYVGGNHDLSFGEISDQLRGKGNFGINH